MPRLTPEQRNERLATTLGWGAAVLLVVLPISDSASAIIGSVVFVGILVIAAQWLRRSWKRPAESPGTLLKTWAPSVGMALLAAVLLVFVGSKL
jgi:hypothetical protein